MMSPVPFSTTSRFVAVDNFLSNSKKFRLKIKIVKLFANSQRKYPPKRYFVCERPSVVNNTLFINPAYTGENIRLPVCPSADFSYLQYRHPFYPNFPPPVVTRFSQHLYTYGFSLEGDDQNLPKDYNNTNNISSKICNKDSVPPNSAEPLKDMSCLTNEELYGGPIKFEYLLNSADIMKNKHFLGEYKNKYYKHPVHGNPIYPADVIPHIAKYNLTHPEKAIPAEELKCDIIKCRSDGIVVELLENTDFYNGEGHDKHIKKEPRFIIQTVAGYISKQNITLGQEFFLVNKEARETVFDNRFRLPKSYRAPLVLPNKKVIL